MPKPTIVLSFALLACSSPEASSTRTEPEPAAPAAPATSEASEPLPSALPASEPSQASSSEAPPAVGLGGSETTSSSGEAVAQAAPDASAPPAEAQADAGAPPPPALPGGPLTIYLAGDSTVSTYRDTPSPTDQAGWGQMFGALFDERITIENRAIGGRTARRFIDEGFLATILADIQPGDYLLVQFGTNDGNRTATYALGGQTIPYYLDPATDFKAYLQRYIDGAREAQANPVLVTPPPRNSAYCTGGNGTGAHARAMLELGAAESVPVLNLNAKSVAFLQAICPSPTPENFFLVLANGNVDGTHFQERGARFLAGFVAEGIAEARLPLAEYLSEQP